MPVPRQTLFRAFVNAFVGIADFAKERNSRIHLTVAVVVLGLAAVLRLPRGEWAILLLTISGVLSLEAMNCAIERAVDLASPQRHELARQAKDMAAGAVLIASIVAVVIGVLLLGPPLIALVRLWG